MAISRSNIGFEISKAPRKRKEKKVVGGLDDHIDNLYRKWKEAEAERNKVKPKKPKKPKKPVKPVKPKYAKTPSGSYKHGGKTKGYKNPIKKKGKK